MKINKLLFKKARISLCLMVMASIGLHAQNPNYLCELRNDVQVDAQTFEFDVYLLRTGSTTFEYSSMQFGININSGASNGGTITVSLVAGTSQLNASQIPSSDKFTFDAVNNCIRMTGTSGPGAGSGTIISNSGFGTRLGRIRLVNTANFGSVQPNLTWSFSIANGYITKVNAYVGGLATEITVQASHTTSNLLNLTLNPVPTAFAVTGTGSYCQVSGGLPVGLTGSENGVTYTLFKNSSATISVPGTGGAISFGNQLFGIYTVSGTNGGGTTNMTGSAILTENATPVAPAVGVVNNCNGTSTLTASGYTGTLLWSNSATTPSITVGTAGTYTVTQTLSGCTSSAGSGTAAPKTTPVAPGVSVVDNCGSSTLTATGYTGTLLWSNSATTVSITVNTPGTYAVTQTVNGCTSSTGSGTAAPKSTPPAPTVTVVDNCNGTSTLTASGFTGTLLWSTSATTASITVNTAGTYTVTQTVSGCASSAGSGTAAPKTTPAAPTVALTQPTCSVGTGTITISAPTGAGMTYSIDGLTYTNTTGIFNLVTPGVYSVTAKNASGCISTGTSETIAAQPPTPVIPAQITSATSGALFIYPPTGGTIPAGTTYTWTAPTYTNGVTGGSAQLIPQANINGTLTIPSGVGTAVYTVTPTSGACVGATFTVTINVTSTCTGVTVGTQPADIATCAVSGIATFTVVANGTAPFTYQWQYNNGGIWGSVVNGTPAGAVYTNATTSILSVTGISTPGSYQYRCALTNCSGGNLATSGLATLTVNALPIPTLTSSIPGNTFCLGTSVTFTAGGGTTNYDFRVNGASRQNGPTSTFTTTSLANGQIVTVVVTGANGCTATSAGITNIVNQPPYIVGIPTATCATDFLTYSVVLTVSTGTVTSTSGTATNTVGNTWTVSLIPAGVNVTLTITDINGCQTPQSITAPNCLCPVVQPPVSGGNRSYCAGGIIPALTATVLTGEIVEWYANSSGGTPLATGTSFTPTTQGTYYAQAKNSVSNCVSNTRTSVVLTMNPLPVPTLTSSDADNIFCSGTSITFTATGGTNYNFLVGGTSRQDGVSATFTTNLITNGQAVNVVVTNATACVATAGPITNTVNPTPVPTLTSSDADNSFCSGTNVTFTAGGGTNYDFRIGGVSVQNGVLTTYSTSSLTNGQVVDVVVSNTIGCSATSAAITNSVFAAPTANAGTGGNNCGLGFHLNGSLNIGTGTWSKVSGPGNVSFSPDANTPTALATVTLYGTYTFSWTVANGTCSSSANVTVIFIQQPPANAGSGGDECDKDFITKAVLTTGVGTWSKVSGPGNVVFTPDNHQINTKITVDQFGTYKFGWTVVNSICTSSDVIQVVFHDLPPVNAGRDTAFCKGGSMQLHAVGVGAVSWVPAATVSNPIIINPVATPDTTTTYTVNLTDQFGCKNSDNIVVEVRVKPVANAGPDQELPYLFATAMDATLAHSYETGVWSLIPDSGTGEFSDSTNSKTEVSSLSLGKNKFLWKVKNGYCPASSDTVMITVNKFIVPTLITPNMDGRNDYFVLKGLATLGKTELIIFDRRGTQVYRDKNYDNSWNGVDYNKNPLPSDTYFYVIKSEIGKSISGYIVIRR